MLSSTTRRLVTGLLVTVALLTTPVLWLLFQGPHGGGPVLDGRPGRILDGVYSLGDVGPLNLYVVQATDGLVLVDAGYTHDYARTCAALRELGLDPKAVRHVLLTHLHLDHYQAAERFRREHGARVYAGADEARLLGRGPTWELANPGRPALGGEPPPALAVDRALADGEDTGIPGLDLRALATPGHTPGHTSYLLRTGGLRVLFAGDAVESFGAEFGAAPASLPPRYGGDPEAYLRTLDRLAAIEPDVLLPAHPYEDRLGGGPAPNPFLEPGQWRARLAQGRTELERLAELRRGGADDFLEGAPRRLLPGLWFLGLHEGRAAYALATTSGEDGGPAPRGLVLVDPGPVARATGIQQVLAGLGLDPATVRALLLTELSPDAAGAAGELALVSGATVYAGAAEAARADAPPLPAPPQAVEDGQVLDLDGLRVRALATPGQSAGGLTWIATLPGGRTAAFTGERLRPLDLDGRPVAPQGTDTLTATRASTRAATQATSSDLAAGLDRLGAETPDLWLPARPFAGSRARLAPAAWARILEANRAAPEGS